MIEINDLKITVEQNDTAILWRASWTSPNGVPIDFNGKDMSREAFAEILWIAIKSTFNK